MTIEIKRNVEELVLQIVGRLDTTTAPTLEKTIVENMNDIKSEYNISEHVGLVLPPINSKYKNMLSEFHEEKENIDFEEQSLAFRQANDAILKSYLANQGI